MQESGKGDEKNLKFQASESLFAGVVVSSPSPLRVEEGGAGAEVLLTATVPVLCSPQDRAFGECCVHLRLAVNEIDNKQFCPWGDQLHRVSSFFFVLWSNFAF